MAPRRPDTPSETRAAAALPMSEFLQVLAQRGVVRKLRKRALIISEGDVGDTLYIVLEGKLRAFSADANGKEVTYGVYGPGEYVGEMSLDGGPRSANVEATEATVCVAVNRPTLERHLAEYPGFAFELLAKVIRRARAATLSLKQIALNNVYGRLKALLESMAVAQADGTQLIDPAPTQKELSQSLGCGRPMVNRVMHDLQLGGYVDVCRGRIVMLKRLPDQW